MNILILHRIPYYKIEYHRGIDHSKHSVVYIGLEENLNNIPRHIQCKKIIRNDSDDIVDSIANYIIGSNINFDRIISLSEYELVFAAKLRELFNIEGPRTSEVELVRNKVLMKKAMFRHGIKVPEFYSIKHFVENKDVSLNAKVVVKPIDGASSENVIVFENTTDLRSKLKSRNTGIGDLDRNSTHLERYEVEEFVEGEIIHIDGLVLNGSVLISLASQYVGTCLEYANGLPLGSVQIPTTSTLKNWTQLCINAARIKYGSFHLEAIQTKEGLVFLEIANRVGGADVVKTFELSTGVHLPSEELKLQLGEQPCLEIEKNYAQNKFGWFVFPGHQISSGYVKIINSAEFKTHPCIVEWHELTNNQLCKPSVTYQPNEVPIAGIIQGKDTGEMIKFIQNMFKKIKLIEINGSLGILA